MPDLRIIRDGVLQQLECLAAVFRQNPLRDALQEALNLVVAALC